MREIEIPLVEIHVDHQPTLEIHDQQSTVDHQPTLGLTDTEMLVPKVIPATTATAIPSRELRELVKLNCFWFGYHFVWFLVTIVTMPEQIETIMGSSWKGVGLAVISIFSGILYLVASPIAGALNDRTKTRKPWIMTGSIGMCLSLFLMTRYNSLWSYTIAYLFLNSFAIICSIPFNGFVADLTPSGQNGVVSSIMGAANLLGYLFGAILGIGASSMSTYTLYVIMSIVFLSCTYITCTLPERNASSNTSSLEPIQWKRLARDIMAPLFLYPNFRMVFLSRFLFQLGIATIQSFLQYWISDCVTSDYDATTSVSIAMLPNLILAPIAALLTPRTERKLVVYFSALMMCIAAAFMMFSTQFWSALFVSSTFGIGYGPFLTVEFAMLMDVLPNQVDAARDMSLWHTALILPQIISTPLAGGLLDWFQDIGKHQEIHCLGYKVTNLFTMGYLLLGAVVTYYIRGIR